MASATLGPYSVLAGLLVARILLTSLGGGAAGTFLGRPPALREGPAPSTLLLFGFGGRTPLALGMVPFEHRPVRLLREGAAQGTMSVRKELAKRLGQLFPASHRPRRCAYQRRWYQTAGSAHLLDTVGLGEPRVNLGDGKRALSGTTPPLTGSRP